MNIANKITLSRILMIPIIALLLLLTPTLHVNYQAIDVFNYVVVKINNYELKLTYLIAGILFIFASLTDFVDGYVARKYNIVTTFGKFYDAIADKLLTNVVLILFACFKILPIWVCVILICRDFVIDVVRQILANASVVMAANKMGKWKATFEMFGLTILFFFGSQSWVIFNEYSWTNQVILIPMYITTILSVLSAINYIKLNKKILLSSSNEKTNKSKIDKNDNNDLENKKNENEKK